MPIAHEKERAVAPPLMPPPNPLKEAEVPPPKIPLGELPPLTPPLDLPPAPKPPAIDQLPNIEDKGTPLDPGQLLPPDPFSNQELSESVIDLTIKDMQKCAPNEFKAFDDALKARIDFMQAIHSFAQNPEKDKERGYKDKIVDGMLSMDALTPGDAEVFERIVRKQQITAQDLFASYRNVLSKEQELHDSNKYTEAALEKMQKVLFDTPVKIDITAWQLPTSPIGEEGVSEHEAQMTLEDMKAKVPQAYKTLEEAVTNMQALFDRVAANENYKTSGKFVNGGINLSDLDPEDQRAYRANSQRLDIAFEYVSWKYRAAVNAADPKGMDVGDMTYIEAACNHSCKKLLAKGEIIREAEIVPLEQLAPAEAPKPLVMDDPMEEIIRDDELLERLKRNPKQFERLFKDPETFRKQEQELQGGDIRIHERDLKSPQEIRELIKEWRKNPPPLPEERKSPNPGDGRNLAQAVPENLSEAMVQSLAQYVQTNVNEASTSGSNVGLPIKIAGKGKSLPS